MLVGYGIIFSALFIYIASLVWRIRRLRREQSMMDELEAEKKGRS
jgi:hypothetical protein